VGWDVLFAMGVKYIAFYKDVWSARNTSNLSCELEGRFALRIMKPSEIILVSVVKGVAWPQGRLNGQPGGLGAGSRVQIARSAQG